jgi:hypothetical protein
MQDDGCGTEGSWGFDVVGTLLMQVLPLVGLRYV